MDMNAFSRDNKSVFHNSYLFYIMLLPCYIYFHISLYFYIVIIVIRSYILMSFTKRNVILP